MAPPIEGNPLEAGWRALSNLGDSPGWRTIAIGTYGCAMVLAGRKFPGNMESMLTGFPANSAPTKPRLPSGRGFTVTQPEHIDEHGPGLWFSLDRQPEGNPELFSAMTADVLGMLESKKSMNSGALLGAFLTRIASWQDFMERQRPDVLGREAEIGLFGELVVLHQLIALGLAPRQAVEGWQGPLEGVQDFLVGDGAVEVKSTVTLEGFQANVGSLEQLDESVISNLFLGCVRIPLDPDGYTLVDQIGEVEKIIGADPFTVSLFNGRLIRAGYFAVHAPSYTRRYRVESVRILAVADKLPRITYASVMPGIREAQYKIDLGGLDLREVPLLDVLRRTGAIQPWN